MLATIDQLLTRLGVADLPPLELARANAALEDASALVTGVFRVVPDPVPAPVVTVVLRAAERGFRNPTGSISHTAGIYSESFDKDSAGGVYLTDQERDILKPYSKNAGGLVSVPMTRPYINTLNYAPVTYSNGQPGEPIPWS